MDARALKSPALVWLLVLHLGHLPIPWWDGDDMVTSPASAAVWTRPADGVEPQAERLWDVDVLLLGIAPPADPDAGPFRHDPDSPYGETGFGLPYVQDSGVTDSYTPLPAQASWQPHGLDLRSARHSRIEQSTSRLTPFLCSKFRLRWFCVMLL